MRPTQTFENDKKSEASSDEPNIVQEVIAEAEDDSSDNSEPQVVMGIISEEDAKDSDEESTPVKEEGSENNSTSHV